MSRNNIMKPMLSSMLAIILTGCLEATPETNNAPHLYQQSYTSIYWSDADSGRLGEFKFRIANKDAPETGSLRQRGGAKCEAERKLGYEAKAYMVQYTKGKTIKMEREYGEDRYGRRVVDLSANGDDVGTAGVRAGHLRDWPHKNGRALFPKPDWCSQSTP